MNENRLKNISKRNFMKLCALGAGGCLLAPNFMRSVSRKGSYEAILSGDWEKWTREALFYRKTPDGLQCEKCPQGCLLQNGDSGFCRNRVARDGKLYTIAYGNPCAVHIDPIEKKPLFHFLPTTKAFSLAVAGCNFRCLNCQNWQISQFSPKETENVDMMPEEVVRQCKQDGCTSIAYTYSEPTTFYEYAFDTATRARQSGIKNVWKSNGFINEAPLRKLCTVIDAANIDLKSYDDEIYKKLSSGKLDPVLRTLKVFKEEGIWLEITNLVIPTWTDNLDMIKRMCTWLVKNGLTDCPLHFSRFTPLYKLTQLPLTPVSTLERARAIALDAGVKYVYIGNVPAHDAENTYCHRCKKKIIERRGFAILNNYLTAGKCKFCGEMIPGVWK
jgi:pyruvate formate lyase activating enzyme